MSTPMFAAIRCSLMLLVSPAAYAGSAQWNLNPTSGDWNTAGNWTPTTVPDGPADIATFALSNTTAIFLSANTEVSGITFSPAAVNTFTIAPHHAAILILSGLGIQNDSGIMQNFLFTDGPGSSGTAMEFTNTATAGALTTFTNEDDELEFFDNATAGNGIFFNNASGVFSGSIEFHDNSTAGNATFTNNSGPAGYSEVRFFENSTAGSSTIVNNGGTATSGLNTGATSFQPGSTAGNSTIINNGGTGTGTRGGTTTFTMRTTADAATLIASSGTDDGQGGGVFFQQKAKGGTSRIEVFGNGYLEITPGQFPWSLTVGSIEGDGDIFLGTNTLTVGSNNLSTTFSGVIEGDGSGGSLTKIGNGMLVLNGENTYSGGTAIKGGQLVINNTTGSGTGSGPVQVNAGLLGGSGIIGGDVTVGDGSRRRATLSPGDSGQRCDTLTMQSTLTFQSDALYKFDLDTRTAESDSVVANGVTINSGALFHFTNVGHRRLPIGTIFTVIDNISANPISGTFSNLPDQSTFTKGNTYQVSYQGGDGNDLTLTVVR